ncbi:hypothetical protein DZK27_10945 [Rhodobacteraceae bacterium 63075]|nr:hypothetical protein DZK27_10945 [Rhodobacteraceae bacterium 63075]
MPLDFGATYARPDGFDTQTKKRRGRRSYNAGRAAEEIARRSYEAAGYELVEARWRGEGGEIDLIVTKGELTVFAEVKRARCFASAAQRIRPDQMARIAQAAEEYAGGLARGSLSEMRIDVALVNEAGACEIIENAFGG